MMIMTIIMIIMIMMIIMILLILMMIIIAITITQIISTLIITTHIDINPPSKEYLRHTCHNLPPSEINGGLFFAVFTGSEGRYLFHRIG